MQILTYTEQIHKKFFWYNSTSDEGYYYMQPDNGYRAEETAKWQDMPFDLMIPTKQEETWDRLKYAMDFSRTIKKINYKDKNVIYLFIMMINMIIQKNRIHLVLNMNNMLIALQDYVYIITI